MAQPLSPKSDPRQDAKLPDFIQRGKILIVRRQFQEAVKVCRLGLLAHPTYVEGRLVLSMALMALARHDEVLAEMRVALELEPDNPMAHLLKGEALHHKRDFEQAREVLEYAQALDPHNEKVNKLLDEIADVIDYGQEPGPRARTETKVYPAQRSLTSGFDADPSDVLSHARAFADWEARDRDDDEEPTATDEAPPSLLAPLRPGQALIEATPDEEETDEERFRAHDEEDDDEEFTTAPFLPPTHLGQRLKQLEDSEWMEPTVAEDTDGTESSVIIRPEDLTVEEQSGVDKLVIDDPASGRGAQRETWRDDEGWESLRESGGGAGWTEREEIADERWADPGPPTDDPLAAFKTPPGGGPVYEEDPTLVPGQSRDVPPPLAALEDEVPTDHEEPTVIPGRHRTGPIRSSSTASVSEEEEEEDDTVVNADAVPSEALFGDEDDGERLEPKGGDGWPRPAPGRSVHDPTMALDIEREHPGREPSGEVDLFSGVFFSDAIEDDEGTREIAPDDRCDSTPAHEVSSADIYSEEIDALPDSMPRPDPFAAVIRASAPIDDFEGDLSEISVEMLPDDAEMPPLPLDAQNSSLYDLSASEVAPEIPDPPPSSQGRSLSDEEDQHATRVNFDVPDEEAQAPPQLDPYADPYGGQGQLDPLAFEPVGEARRYLDPPGHYDSVYDDGPVEPYPVAGPGVTYNVADEDEDELSLEPAEESGQQPWPQGPVRTAALEPDDDQAYPYLDGPGVPALAREPTSETRPAGPQGIRGGAPLRDSGGLRAGSVRGADAPVPAGDGMLEQLTGDSGLFLRQAHTDGRARVRKPRERHPDRTATSWLTILVGEPGSHRWIYLLLSAFGVLALAVAVGLAVRYYRLGEQIEAKRKQAELRLRAGNMPDFMSAAQSYADILGRRGDDQTARAAHARILAAIPLEFGDPIPQTSMTEGDPEGASADRVAAEVYTLLYGGALERAATRVLEASKQFPESSVLPYLAGRIALLEGNAGAAVRHLERAHERDAKDTLILRSLGLALAAQGKSDAALLAFQKALATNPDHVASLLDKAQTLISTRQLIDEAQVDLNTIVVGKRKNLASRGQRGWAYLLLARLYFNKGQLDQAKHHISRAKSNMPSRDAPFLDELAGVLIDAFQLGEAENAIKQSIKIMKGRPHPFYHMARIHLLHGRPRAALGELNRAKGLQYAASNLLRAKILLELGQLARAEAEVDRALGMAEDLLDAHIIKAKVLAAKGQGSEAEAKLEELLRKHPRNATLLTACGEILLKLGRLGDARARFQEAIAHDKQAFGARLKLAEVFMSEGKFGEARSSLADAVRSNPGNIMVLMKQAELELDMGELAEAATNYYEAHRRAPNDANIRLELARVLTLQRKFSQAEKEITAAEAHGASRDMLALARGRLALYRNNASLAVNALITATKGRPTDVEGWELLAAAHLMNNDTASAQQVAGDMAARFPNTPEAVATLARVDLNEGQSSQAVRRLGPLLSQLSRSARPPRERSELLILLGRAFQDNGKLGEAAAKYEEALKVCPVCPEPHYRRGLVQDERGQVEEAIGSLKKAVSLDPLYSEVYYDLGQVYERSGQTAAAIESYQKYLTFNPPRDLARAAEEAIRALKGGG